MKGGLSEDIERGPGVVYGDASLLMLRNKVQYCKDFVAGITGFAVSQDTNHPSQRTSRKVRRIVAVVHVCAKMPSAKQTRTLQQTLQLVFFGWVTRRGHHRTISGGKQDEHIARQSLQPFVRLCD